MAVDTAAKRNSVLAIITRLVPLPDSTISQSDRQALVEVYSGVLAGAAAPPSPFTHERISIPIGIGL